MTSTGIDLVALALREPGATRSWSPPTWSALVQQARAAGLLGRLAERLAERPAGEAGPAPWPPAAQGHFESALRLVRAQQAEVERESSHVRAALAGLEGPVVLLKGAAYVMAGLPAAQGRVFSDLDILLPRAQLDEAESRLMRAGWVTTHLNAYDQRYYREWSHELPPMQHVQRQTTLDVHHTILPATARLKPRAALLFESARPLPGVQGLHVLAPADMVLHSMTHLFMNEDMSHALRDLSDLDLLLRHFGATPGFWDGLAARADQLELGRPLFYGLRFLRRVFDTPVPPAVQAQVEPFGPPRALGLVMDWLWHRALRTPHPGAAPPLRALALFALYLRGHWLRMPLPLLARHLTIKALRLHERSARADAQAP